MHRRDFLCKNRSLGIFRHFFQMMIGVLNHLLIIVSHTIHVWYIYLHWVDFYGFHVAKYTSPMEAMGYFSVP